MKFYTFQTWQTKTFCWTCCLELPQLTRIHMDRRKIVSWVCLRCTDVKMQCKIFYYFNHFLNPSFRTITTSTSHKAWRGTKCILLHLWMDNINKLDHRNKPHKLLLLLLIMQPQMIILSVIGIYQNRNTMCLVDEASGWFFWVNEVWEHCSVAGIGKKSWSYSVRKIRVRNDNRMLSISLT